MTASFDAALARAREAVAARASAVLADDDLGSAMAYALQGGKGFRGFLVLEGARLHGIEDERCRDAALAVECIHAYSLVHDDLPAMDDDDLRRGRPTLHRARDEATAILAGDALQALAFELLAGRHFGDLTAPLVASLARDAGAAGMVGGQMLDIAAERAAEPLDLTGIERLQALKTGALIGWSAAAGPVIARADPGPMAAYGAAIGRAFQIADDLLDATGAAAETGKAVGKDAGRGKATFVSLLGIEGARARAADLVEAACAALAPYGARAEVLLEAARYVVARRK